jgi:hypothetical protein
MAAAHRVRPCCRARQRLDLHCGSRRLRWNELRWSHAFFKWITREPHAPGARDFGARSLRWLAIRSATTIRQCFIAWSPRIQVKKSRRGVTGAVPGELSRGAWRRSRPYSGARSNRRTLIAEKAGNGLTRRISVGRPTHPVVLMGNKNINANSSDQARAHFPVRRLILTVTDFGGLLTPQTREKPCFFMSPSCALCTWPGHLDAKRIANFKRFFR